ncbi:SIS domain-containing protein [Vallitalea maricola]|uniref:Sugar isomerase domain-containing protein n=1 Tax=Vallitalea maricola TaxID=3074433 RepID=A0ACB5UIE6_9FIRM|nr:sugar isomerase domain-containing protein [Vallitalea sp. AN17-2]
MNNNICINKYLDYVKKMLNDIEKTQKENIKEASNIISRCIQNKGILHVFSTGHSHMIVEEMFYRAGGLVQVNPILDPGLMQHEGAIKSTKLERLSGYAEILIESVDFKENEPIIIISNSGINSVPIEMAMLAKEKGLNVIAITSIQTSSTIESRHESNKKLMDVADIVIDNCVPRGDTIIDVGSTDQKIGSVSSIAGIFIVQRLILDIVNNCYEEGKIPPIYTSANMPGGDEHNSKLIYEYKSRVRGLY